MASTRTPWPAPLWADPWSRAWQFAIVDDSLKKVVGSWLNVNNYLFEPKIENNFLCCFFDFMKTENNRCKLETYLKLTYFIQQLLETWVKVVLIDDNTTCGTCQTRSQRRPLTNLLYSDWQQTMDVQIISTNKEKKKSGCEKVSRDRILSRIKEN